MSYLGCWNLAVGYPGPDRLVGDSKDLGGSCIFHVFTPVGHNSSPPRLEFDLRRKFTKHYSEMTALQMREIQRTRTFIVRFPPANLEKSVQNMAPVPC